MRYLITLLLAAAVLTGCGAKKTTPEAPEISDPPPGVSEPAPQGLSMYLEHEIYDPSLDVYTYMIDNRTEETVTVGEDYSIEKETGSSWLELPMETDWIAVAHVLEPGSQIALRCSFSATGAAPEPGDYRLSKKVQMGEREVRLSAEFSLGESPYTADSPYNFLPLEKLPEQYSAADAKADGAVTVTELGTEGIDYASLFVENVTRNIPCQIRIAQEFNEGNTMVMDAVYSQGKFRWSVRSGGGITEKYFPYIVTDGKSICLSNGSDWETSERLLGSELVYLLPENTEGLETAVAQIERLTAERLQENSIRYCSWSPDGLYCAARTDVTGELLIQSAERGDTFTVTDEQGRPAAIRELEWDDGLLLIYTEKRAQAFDPERWILHK